VYTVSSGDIIIPRTSESNVPNSAPTNVSGVTQCDFLFRNSVGLSRSEKLKTLICGRLLILRSGGWEAKKTSAPTQRCPTRLIPLDVFDSESVAADLLQQVRWRDDVSCLAVVLTLRSKMAAIGFFSGISVRTATTHSATRLVRFSLTRKSRSDGSCSRFTRFSGLARVSSSHSAKSMSSTRQYTTKLNTSSERLMRLRSISLDRSKSTNCASLPGRKDASATKSCACVACPRVDRTTGTSPHLHSR